MRRQNIWLTDDLIKRIEALSGSLKISFSEAVRVACERGFSTASTSGGSDPEMQKLIDTLGAEIVVLKREIEEAKPATRDGEVRAALREISAFLQGMNWDAARGGQLHLIHQKIEKLARE